MLQALAVRKVVEVAETFVKQLRIQLDKHHVSFQVREIMYELTDAAMLDCIKALNTKTAALAVKEIRPQLRGWFGL